MAVNGAQRRVRRCAAGGAPYRRSNIACPSPTPHAVSWLSS